MSKNHRIRPMGINPGLSGAVVVLDHASVLLTLYDILVLVQHACLSSTAGMLHCRAASLVLLAFLVMSTAACGSKEGELNGEVFIVTKGSQNVRLGLVEVRAIAEDVIKPFIDQKIMTSRAETERLRPEIEKARAEVAEAEEALKAAQRVRDKQFNARMEAIRRGDFSTSRSYSSAGDITLSKTNTKHDKQIQLLALLNKMIYWQSGDFYFSNLPVGIATTNTDADGKFSLTLNKQQRYALAAHGTRVAGDTTEKYFWLFWVSLDGKDAKHILVSNNTLFEVAHTDAVVRLEEKTTP